ncbi:hypothetical protein F511_06902 [Dorcoceras hygrometricum]|uniref:Uncharacterized protein n=1 Tax=Dorcoceras hygrometricum TaxID=472368 RepID=A0A2Z7D4Z9_9LAMI|nr:hypothetical protein F511_06902 [Dorcoceras hygrometricum]
MADYRSKSFADANMQIQPYFGPPYKYNSTRHDDFRSYSASYASSSSNTYSAAVAAATTGVGEFGPQKLKKARSNGGSTLGSWSFKDPEFQRKKRVASYKVYAVEGRVKGSFTKSYRWLKDRYTQVVYGWW